MKYILIAIFYGSFAGTSLVGEFNNQDACLKAKRTIQYEMQSIWTKMVCVEKGMEKYEN